MAYFKFLKLCWLTSALFVKACIIFGIELDVSSKLSNPSFRMGYRLEPLCILVVSLFLVAYGERSSIIIQFLAANLGSARPGY